LLGALVFILGYFTAPYKSSYYYYYYYYYYFLTLGTPFPREPKKSTNTKSITNTIIIIIKSALVRFAGQILLSTYINNGLLTVHGQLASVVTGFISTDFVQLTST